MQDAHRVNVAKVILKAVSAGSHADAAAAAVAAADALYEAGLLYEPHRVEPLAHPQTQDAEKYPIGNFATAAYGALDRAQGKVRGVVKLMEADCDPDDPMPRVVALGLGSLVDLTAAVVYSLTDVALSVDERTDERGR